MQKSPDGCRKNAADIRISRIYARTQKYGSNVDGYYSFRLAFGLTAD